MVERHIIRPSAGRMRPNTSESGIFSTKRKRPVRTSMLTRMLVPNPKNAFQSLGVHSAGRFISDAIDVMRPPYRSMARLDCFGARASARSRREAGHPIPVSAEVHDAPGTGQPASLQQPQKLKPKPLYPTHTSR